MTTITEYLSQDHVRCDGYFIAAETATSQHKWPEAEESFQDFRHAMERHLSIEERVLFPRFEAVIGAEGGPTRVMRMEHERMRELIEAMRQAVGRHDAQGYLDLSETLLILMRQHNLKEEQMLYPMSDHRLGAAREEVLTQLRSPAPSPGIPCL
jgi:hemerythrin-like domain-containing protein